MPDKRIKMTENNICEVCGSAARQFCSSCRAVFYCSRECQKKGWKAHKAHCSPIILQHHHQYGRHMVASRDIKAGEVILKESAIIVGPKQRTVPMCLGCHKIINGTYRCSKCRYPMCAPSCETSVYHKAECEILSKSVGKVLFESLNQPHHAYDCITPLRCLITQRSDPKTWEVISNLQSHYDEIKNSDIYRVNQINIVDFLKKMLEYPDADEELIHRISGILITNSFELKHNGQRVRGLFPQGAMIAHSCTPNTKHTFDEDLNIIFRTTTNVSKGTPINISYTQILWNTLARRRHLKLTKFFYCSCKRCSDPHELGTELSTLICSVCGGHITSSAPLKDDSPWSCDKCGHTLKGSQVLWGDDALYKELKDQDQSTSKYLERFLASYTGSLHAGHRFFVETKYALCKYYGNYPGYSYSEITRTQLDNKIEYCKQLLKLAEVVDSGKSLFRGTILFELQAANVALAKTLLSCEEITQEECGEKMTEAVKILQEASEILKHEPDMEKGGLDDRLSKLSKDLEL